MKILDTKKKEYYIYALLTRTNDLFYIGKTKNHPNERIKQHFHHQTNKEMADQFYWFRKYNEMPYYFIIE